MPAKRLRRSRPSVPRCSPDVDRNTVPGDDRRGCNQTPANDKHSRVAEMRKREDEHSSIIDAIPTMAWSRRPDGFIEFVNRRWLDFTGFSSDQALGWGCLAAFHPDDRGPLAEKWRALVSSGPPGEIEARVRRHDGEYRWFLLRAEPVRDEDGRIIRWYGGNIDIEDRKR